MRLRVISFLILFASALVKAPLSMAQVEAGPLVGVNRSITTLRSDCARRSAAPGWMLGVLLRAGGRAFAEIAPQYITVSEMTEGTEGLRPMADGEDPLLRGKLSARYLFVPVSTGFKLYHQEDLNVHIGMGGAFSMLTGLRDNPFSLNRKDFHTTDIAVLGKAGVDFNRFVVDVQYSYGFTSRLRHTDARMQVFSFTVAYKLWGQYVLKRGASFFPG